MTMPLSRTRSRTSTRLDPPAALSTGIGYSTPGLAWSTDTSGPRSTFGLSRGATSGFGFGIDGGGGQLSLQRGDPPFENLAIAADDAARREVAVVHPPVQTDLLGLVEGADDEPDA